MREVVDKAALMLSNLFKNNQHTWPNDMYIYVKVGDIKDIQAVIGVALERDDNAVGARKKE